MKFKEAYLILVPEVDSRPFLTVNPEKDRSVLDTDKYTCYTILVQDQAHALKECKRLVEEEGVKVITLCPGFSYRDIARISEAVGENVGICVARGDHHSDQIVARLID